MSRYDDYAQEICYLAEVDFVGIMSFKDIHLIMFNDRQTHSTLSISFMDLTVKNIKLMIADSRKKFNHAE